jgi:signal transduction histidine kinase
MPTPLRSLRLPHLRLYQQLLISMVLVVVVPLLVIGVAIYTINQHALRKEVSRFAELTAQSVQTELQHHIHWEHQHAKLMAGLLNATPTVQARTQLLQQEGYVWWANAPSNKPVRTLWADPTTPPLPVPSLSTQVVTVPISPTTTRGLARSYVLLLRVEDPKAGRPPIILARRFAALQQLIDQQARLFTKGLAIIDTQGRVIAGPNPANTPAAVQDWLTPSEKRLLKNLKPGVVKRTRQAAQAPLTAKPNADLDEVTNVERVFVRVPNLDWVVVLESPYHVRHTYIRRARDQTLMLMGAYLLLIILFSLFYGVGINRNFRQLIKGIKALTHGNYYRRIRLLSNATTPYEIVILGAEFNRMAKRVADSWDSSVALNRELTQANLKLAKLDELKSTLIDTVSHELRTPLTSIKGYTSRLLRYDDTIDPALRLKSLKIVKQQADRLSRMVDDLLVIPELESARLRVYPDRVELVPLVDAVVQVVGDRSNRDIMVITQAWPFVPVRPPETPQTEETALVDAFATAAPQPAQPLAVLADPDRLEQVLVNLLDNAVKYSPDGSPIQVAITPDEGHVGLHVINQCGPIPPEALARLFEKFTRLDEELTRTTRGSGLGLFITRGLVSSMGGQISLHADNGFFEARVTLQHYTELNADAIETLTDPFSHSLPSSV